MWALTLFEELCLDTFYVPHTLSQLYKPLVAPSAGFVPQYIHKWEEDLHITFSAAQVDQAILFAHKSSIANTFQE